MEVRECKTRSFSNEQYVQRQSLARSFQGFRHRSEVDSVVSTVSCMETCKHRGTPEVFVRASSSPQGTLAPTPTRTSSDQASAVIKRQCRRLILSLIPLTSDTTLHNTEHTALLSPKFRAFLSKKTPAAAMERQPQQQAARRTLPRRGQIKVRIFASLFRCLVPKAAPRKEAGKNKEGSSSRVSPSG